jgi:hypothetical protein
VARQAQTIGDDIRPDGHLEDPRLEFPFATRPFGTPAAVHVHEVPTGDLLYVE